MSDIGVGPSGAKTSELTKRVTSGVVGGALLVGFLFFAGSVGVYIVTLVLCLGMTAEAAQIGLGLSDQLEKKYVFLLMAWAAVTSGFLLSDSELGIVTGSFVVLFTYFLLTAGRHAGPDFLAHFRELTGSIFGLVYVVMLPLLLMRLRLNGSDGPRWTLLFLLVVWSGDTAAYFGGKKWGRSRLYPLISPKKTREGALAGLVCGVLVSAVFKLLFFREMSWAFVVVGSIAVGATAQIGDLCESFFKRAYDRKDSGSILPGHGGFLDRFDGVIFAAPVMLACVKVLG